VALNFLAGPRALVRERDHQERREAYIERVWLDSNQTGARRGSADRGQYRQAAGATAEALNNVQ
jgi:hypothetical protein